MAFSRRGFLRALGTGMAMSAVPAIPTLSNAIPFEPARSRRPGSPILLNSNENAYGPSRPVRETLQRALANISRYPVSNDALVARLAELHHVSPESLLVGCGSTEMLRVLAAGLRGLLPDAGDTDDADGALASMRSCMCWACNRRRMVRATGRRLRHRAPAKSPLSPSGSDCRAFRA